MNSKRKFLEKAVASGLACGTVTTDDVVRHADPVVLAANLPVDLKAKLIAASLSAEAMTTALIVETIGTEALAEHLPTPVLWACVAECAGRALGAAPADEVAADDKSKSGADAGGKSGGKSVASAKNGEKPGKVPDIASPKPNVTARPKSGGSGKKPARARGAGATSKRRPSTLGRPATQPVVPRSEFEVDTDIGEEDWGVDDIVEVVEEAEVVGAEPIDVSDWKNEEETVTRDADGKP